MQGALELFNDLVSICFELVVLDDDDVMEFVFVVHELVVLFVHEVEEGH